ncbi:acyl transferase/acyl hydrolase/lysophospholipase [Phlyctochytrium arcticum]|nr:acyl transferase/acyl hydrolase/lysophospholipase [Phlyctochytrium arcticum]
MAERARTLIEDSMEVLVEEDTPDTKSKNRGQVTYQRPTRRMAQGAISVVSDVLSYWSGEIYRRMLRRDLRTYYKHLMGVATDYDQWAAAGAMLDKLTGMDAWKLDPVSPHYDYELVQDRLAQLRKARASGNMSNVIFILRTFLTRNIGDIGNPRLYGTTNVGTKLLIDDYIDEVTRQLHFICEEESPQISLQQKYDFFTRTQQAFGRTALCLSGGGALALCHIGVIKTLLESNLLPRVISGSSGGAIIASCLCTRTDEEATQLLDPRNVNLNFFDGPDHIGGFFEKIKRFFKDGYLYRVKDFTDAMRENIGGDVTFQEAFNRTRRILNITVSSSTVYEMPRLLNYLTAPDVVIWSAVAASCAVPFVYNSCPLLAKKKNGLVPWNTSGHLWIDGSVEGDLPMTRISEMFGVNHFIVCQINPHVVPFISNNPAPSLFTRTVKKFASLVRSEVQHRFSQMSDLGVSSSLVYRMRTILSQRYTGDITIVPWVRYVDYLRLLGNPDPEMYIYCSNLGERATWPQISLLRNRCQIELCIDNMLYRLRIRRFMEERIALARLEQQMHNENGELVYDPRLLGPPTAPVSTASSLYSHSLPSLVWEQDKTIQHRMEGLQRLADSSEDSTESMLPHDEAFTDENYFSLETSQSDS